MKRFSALILLMVGVLGLAACAAAPTATPTAVTSSAVTRISVDQLAQMLEGPKDLSLVNVHIPYEGDLPNTDFSIPYDKIDAHLAELPARDAKIVLYCRSGRMSDIAAQRLAELGYTHVYDVTGGMVAWQASGRQLAAQ